MRPHHCDTSMAAFPAPKLCFRVALLLWTAAGMPTPATSDIAADRAECANSLVGLYSCLQYTGGTAKAPTPECCKGLTQVIDKSKKCLCILIKDRDDPQLGIKFNVTKALSLPTLCRTEGNLTECIDLLHLSPDSKDAQIFKGSAASSPALRSPSMGQGSSQGAGSSSSGGKASSNGRRERWVGQQIMGLGVLTWSLLLLY